MKAGGGGPESGFFSKAKVITPIAAEEAATKAAEAAKVAADASVLAAASHEQAHDRVFGAYLSKRWWTD